jgi:hypothetical protein
VQGLRQRADSAIRHGVEILLVVTIWPLALLLAACGVGTLAVAVVVWTSSMTLDERIAGIAATFTVGAFTLAVIGAAVALLAYGLALQRPKLLIHIATDDFEEGVISVGVGPPDEEGERHIGRLPVTRRLRGEAIAVHISVENTSEWSARNVAVRVDLKGLRRLPHPGGWNVAAYHNVNSNEIVALQWEGGADQAIHGRWTRSLPDLYLTDVLLEAPGDECAVRVDVVAEGFRQAWTYPIKWQTVADMQGKGGGSISGFTSYPASGVPPRRIYAVPVGGKPPRRVDIVVGYGYRWFWFDDLETGEYHILAYPEQYKIAGAFTVGARSSELNAAIEDHTLAPVVVTQGKVTDGVRITDWGETFPAEPSRSLERG